MPTPIALGVDLGQSRDPTALCVIELRAVPALSVVPPPEVHVVELRRYPIGLAYPKVVDEIAGLANTLYFLDPLVVVDNGGVGRAVTDSLRAKNLRNLIAITSTGGHAATMTKRHPQGGESWNVGRVPLLSELGALIYGSRLKVASELSEAKQLAIELQSLEHKVSAAGRETIEVADTDHHADLVSALSLATWRLLRPRIKGYCGRLETLRR